MNANVKNNAFFKFEIHFVVYIVSFLKAIKLIDSYYEEVMKH